MLTFEFGNDVFNLRLAMVSNSRAIRIFILRKKEKKFLPLSVTLQPFCFKEMSGSHVPGG